MITNFWLMNLIPGAAGLADLSDRSVSKKNGFTLTKILTVNGGTTFLDLIRDFSFLRKCFEH